jgi:NADH-quinone oxidoreductase subunit L
MLIPIGLLSVGSIASGFILSKGEGLVHWLEPVVNPLKEHHAEEFLPHLVVSAMTLSVVIIGVSIAVIKYRGDQLAIAPDKVSLLTKAARRDLFQDDLNEVVFMRPGQSLVSNLLNLDYLIIDGLVRAVGSVSITAGSKLRTLQNGYVRSYALMTVIGALALLTVIWAVTA